MYLLKMAKLLKGISSGRKKTPHSDVREGVTLRILQWNAGGLSQTKKTEITKTLTDKNVDIFIIVEANVKENSMKYYNFRGYQMHVLPISRQIAGGILVGVKRNIVNQFTALKEMNHTDKCEIIKLDVWKNEEHFKIYGVYNPPNNTPETLSFDTTKKCILIGDFNAHFPEIGYTDINGAGKEIRDYILSHNVELIYNSQDTPTYLHYNGSTTNPDLLIATTDISSRITRTVKNDPGSGHRAVLATIKSIRPTPNKEKENKKCSWNFKKANWEGFRMELEIRLHPDNFNFNQQTADRNNKKLCAEIMCAAKHNIPRGKIYKYRPFWNEKLEKLRKEREEAREQAEKTKDPSDVIKWRQKAANMRKEITEAKRESYKSFLSQLDYRKDSRKIHKYISSLGNQEFKRTPILTNTKTLADDKKMAKTFTRHYTKTEPLSKQSKQVEKEMIKKVKVCCKQEDIEIFNTDFKSHELQQAIKELKVGKSPGYDNITAEFLKNLGPMAQTTCLLLINQIWHTSIPTEWRKAVIVPILKSKKPPNTITSYRPISLTSILAKTMERMINARLNWYLETQDILCKEQAGFRKNQSTTQQILKFSQEVKDGLDENKATLAVFVDFKNAYDLVWRAGVLDKLRLSGVRGRMLKWIYMFINQRLCTTKINGIISKFKKQNMGLPQGAVVSPTLFNVMINDLPTQLNKIDGIKTALFADDLVIWVSKPRRHFNKLLEIMQQALDRLESWSEVNRLVVNTDKTMYQVFSLAHKIPEINVQYKGQQIKATNEQKYLGIHLDSKLSWKKHINKTAEKAKTRFNILKRLTGQKWGCSQTILNHTYNTYIKPVLLYGGEALISANIHELETTQNQALRIITGAVKTTPIPALEIATANAPLNSEIKKVALIQYEKLIRLSTDNYWAQYQLKQRRLKTQKGFLQHVVEIRNKYVPAAELELLQPPENPLDLIDVEYTTELQEHVKKREIDPYILKSLTLETIHTLYPADEWLHVFTDGSFTKDSDCAGAGIYCKLFKFYASCGKFTSNFDGELEAIYIALSQLCARLHSFSKVVIFCDSMSAIQAISSLKNNVTSKIREIRKSIKNLKDANKIITFQWVPSHIGIEGNEKADYLAKKGTKIYAPAKNSIPFLSIKLLIKSRFKAERLEYLQKISKGKKWESLLQNTYLQSSRKETVAAFRLITGHDCLAQHLHRMNIMRSPNCMLCNSNTAMNFEHLRKCSALQRLWNGTDGQIYWEARRQMAIVPHV